MAEFDWELLRSAAELNGATEIALTFADYLDVRNKNARRYDQLQPETILFIEEIERVARRASNSYRHSLRRTLCYRPSPSLTCSRVARLSGPSPGIQTGPSSG